MNVTVRKIGNSEGVIIPHDVLERMNIKAGDQLELISGTDGLHLKVNAQSAEFARKMEIARARMKKYEVALRELAK